MCFVIKIQIFMTLLCLAEASFVQQEFKKISPGELVTGIVAKRILVQSTFDCSVKCSIDVKCKAYQFNPEEDKNCYIVHGNATAGSPQNPTLKELHAAYKKAASAPWITPLNWTSETRPTVYRDFENENSIGLMNGPTFVTGMFGNAIQTNSSLRQWANLGDLSVACITIPDKCGPKGAAVSVWVKLIHCPHAAGIISSRASETSGLYFICRGTTSIYHVIDLTDGWFGVHVNKPVGWYHVAMNYIGPSDGEGITVYIDGAFRGSDTMKTGVSYSLGKGTTVIGRRYTDQDSQYTTVEVDELTLWNHTLLPEEIQGIYRMNN